MNLGNLATKLDHDQRYDALVSATSRSAAVDIATEALPEGCTVVHVEAEDVAFQEGRDSWQVAIWFAGHRRRAAR
jgi:hypothetical protein